MDDLSNVSAADYLKARDIVADEIKKHSQIQANTRREVAEALMARGWFNVETIIAPARPQFEQAKKPPL